MEKEMIIQKDYKQKIEILKSIFTQYNQAKTQLQELPLSYKSPLFIKETQPTYGNYEHQLLNGISKMNYLQEYIDFINQKLLYLSQTERMIIEHEFIKKTNKHWWEFYFSSATYYRHKKKAVERLIVLLFS